VSYLLDTDVLLWALASPDRLGVEPRRLLERAATMVFASAVSAWEIEIQRGLGKLRAPIDLAAELRVVRFTELPLHLRHVQALGRLPNLGGDPYDRMLVAQAIADDLTLVTHDGRLCEYPVKTLAV
jgi:PIN domain nuclease of toxin-antitoxin system